MPGGTGNSFLHDLNAETYSKAISKLANLKTKKIDVLKLEFNNDVAYKMIKCTEPCEYYDNDGEYGICNVKENGKMVRRYCLTKSIILACL